MSVIKRCQIIQHSYPKAQFHISISTSPKSHDFQCDFGGKFFDANFGATLHSMDHSHIKSRIKVAVTLSLCDLNSSH